MKYKKVYVIASNNYSREQCVCFSGRSIDEAKETIKELKMEDKYHGSTGIWNYIIKGEKKNGEIERCF